MISLILKLMENEALKTAFLKLANMSISASWLVLAVLVLRLVLKKAPKWVNVLLWGIVAVRLICPFSIESALSLIPSTQTIPMNIEMAAKPAIDSGVTVVDQVVNPMIAASFTPNPAASANPLQIWIPLAAVIWCFGMVLMLLYTTICYWRLNRRINTAVLYRDNVFQSENVSSPFVLGINKPKIYLPFKMNEQDLQHVVAHEQAHIRRKDHWWKPLGFLLLTIHWFNPLMWLSYVLLCRDIELACDEKVIKELDSEQRANYTQALVACSVNRRMIAACPLAFGEVDVKERVNSIMNYKRPTFWIIVVAVILCIIIAVCFLTDPIQDNNSDSFMNYKNAISLSERQDVMPAIHYNSVNDQGSIGIGMVEGEAFSIYLDTARWAEKWFTPSDLSSPGSVSVNVADNLRITVYDRNFAAVEFNDEVCYYRTAADDYENILDLLMPADVERLESSAETRLELALGVTTIDENADSIEAGINGSERDAVSNKPTLSQFPSEETKPELMIYPIVPVYVVNVITGEQKIVNSNPSIRAIQSLISSEWWAEGNPACDYDFKITVNEEDFWYHSDCGTFTDVLGDRCITLDESQKEIINELLSVAQNTIFDRYWLTIGADGVKRVEIKTAYSSGGCENADGSLYKKGERIWVECLDGHLDLRGVSFTALDEDGQIIWQASIPDGENNEGFTHLRNNDWNITNIP